MIRLAREGITFHYRVAGVALHDGCVLLQGALNSPIWTLPGGHVEPGETAAAALRREMHEEIEVAVRIERLLWVVENLFPDHIVQHHELGLYFLMDFGDARLRLGPGPYTGNENGMAITVAWHPLTNLETLPLYPAFLRQGLQMLPEHPSHIVTA